MSSPSPAQLPKAVERQLVCVSRRLFLQTYLDVLVWCWVGALVLSAAWFFVQPFLAASAPPWLRWAVAGGLVGAATLLAAGLAILLAPSKLTAALSFDERFGLKERVTTSFTLAPEEAASPAGQALLGDIDQRIGKLDVGERFPVKMSWTAVLVPVCAALFACVALLYEPARTQAVSENREDAKLPVAQKNALKEEMKEILKKKPEKRQADVPRIEELEKLEAKLEEIAKRPPETKEQLREKIKELSALEEKMQKREKELDKSEAVKNQLKKLDRLAQKEGPKEGPAKELQKALNEGNLDKAKEEIDRLSKKLQDKELGEKEQQQLAKQLKDVEDKLKRLAEQPDKQKQLEELKNEGKLDQEAFDREMKNLKEDSEKLKDLQDLADKLGQCQKSLEKGDGKGAEKSLQEASEKLKQMDLDDQELQDLKEQLDRLRQAKEC